MALILGIISLIMFVVFVGCFIRVGATDNETVFDCRRDSWSVEGFE
jgi:hypothetical protein